MSEIVLDHVHKRYGDGGPLAVNDLSLEIGDGEFMVLVGPSGCGKTTALRMVAGLESISEGELRIGDRVVNDLPARDRDIAMVFQNYALYPHMTVADNMGFGLKLARVGKREREERVAKAAKVLGLEEFLDRKPRALSGGQRQRVAMGRAIVREPQAFLMDEPLSNLDAKLRVQMRAEIARLQDELRVTTVYVTHDQVEAMTMGDRVAVMRKGKLQQVGTPIELFNRPRNLFVAGFIGSPSMNFVRSRLDDTDGTLSVCIGEQRLEVDRSVLSERPAVARYRGREVIVGLRPQDMEDAAVRPDAWPHARLRARVLLVESLGTETLVRFPVDAPPVLTDDMRELAADLGEGEVQRMEAQAQQGSNEFVARLDPRTRASAGEVIELAIDTSRLHVFDADTGLGIYDTPSESGETA